MKDIIFKKFEQKDSEIFYDLILKLQDYFTDYQKFTPAKDEVLEEFIYDLPPKTTLNQKRNFLIYKKEQLIGFIDTIFGYPTDDVAMLGYMVLLKEYRNKGIGKQSLEFIENLCRENNITKIKLVVVVASPAYKTWLKLGFKELTNTRFTDNYGEQVMLEKIL